MNWTLLLPLVTPAIVVLAFFYLRGKITQGAYCLTAGALMATTVAIQIDAGDVGWWETGAPALGGAFLLFVWWRVRPRPAARPLDGSHEAIP